jgi:hypothetical protein
MRDIHHYFPFSILTSLLILCPVFSHPAPSGHPAHAVADTNIILPPAWAFGIIYGTYTNQQQSIELIDQMIAHDYPIDGFWNDSWIWDWQNKGRDNDETSAFIGALG